MALQVGTYIPRDLCVAPFAGLDFEAWQQNSPATELMADV